MEMTKPFCEYNCDYPCSLCLQAHRKGEEEAARLARIAARRERYNPLLENEDEMPWNGYLGQPANHGITKFTDEGYPIGPVNHHNTGTSSYAPPPFKELVRHKIVEPTPLSIEGPNVLVKRRIVV